MGIDGNRPGYESHGVFMVAALIGDEPQQVVGVRVVRLPLENASIEFGGLRQSASLMMAHGEMQIPL